MAAPGTMQKVDILIAASLVVAAVASAIGVMTYEDTRGASEFEVTFATRDTTLEDLPSGTAAGGAEARLSFPVNLTNLTTVELVVRISGGSARATAGAVSVLVEVPGGEAVEAEGTIPAGPAGNVDIPVTVTLSAVPQGTSLRARSAEEALAQAGAATTNGTGEWNVTVAIPGGLPGPIGAAAPYTVSLTGTATTFFGEARPILPEVRR